MKNIFVLSFKAFVSIMALSLLITIVPEPLSAQEAMKPGITMDNSLTSGTPVTLSGPDYDIKAEYGKQVGSNLFHSFEQFNLYEGQTATFSGPGTVSNIISRVTGSNSSFLDGQLKSTIPNANFYLINPNGIVFGPHASIDIGGAFCVSTADYLNFADQTRFQAKPEKAEVLSCESVQAFGFLSRNPATITLNGTDLSVHECKTISMIGGNIVSSISKIPDRLYILSLIGLKTEHAAPKQEKYRPENA